MKNIRYLTTLSILFLTFGLPAFGQTGLTLYNMTYIPQSNQLNPGRIPLAKVSVMLPGLSGNHLQMGSSLTSFDGLGFNLEGLLESNFDEEIFVENLLDNLVMQAANENRGFINYQADLLGVGVRIKHRHYVGFSIQQMLQSQVVLPYDAFRLARDVNSDFETGSGLYDFSASSFSAVAYRPYTLTYAYEVAPEFSFGVNASYITGTASLYSEIEQAFFNNPADNPLGFEMSGSMEFATGGIQGPDSVMAFQDIILGTGNSGFGFGAGANARLLDDQLELSASVVNLGFINWDDNVATSRVDVNIVNQADSIGQLLEEAYEFEYSPNQSYRQMLHPQVFVGANYFLGDETSVGLLLRGTPVNGRFNPAVGAFFNTRVQKWLGLSVGYNYADRSHQLATGFSLNLGPVQWYLLTDNILGPLRLNKTKQVQLSTGINLTFGRLNRTDRAPEDPMGLPEVSDEDPIPPYDDSEDYSDADPFGPVPQDTLPPEPDKEPGPEVIDDKLDPDPYPDLMDYVARVDAYMYRGPAANTIAIDTIPEAIEVEVLQKFSQSWWFVRGPETNGWVQSAQLAPNPPKTKPYIPQPVVEEPEVEDPEKTPASEDPTPPQPQGPVDDGVNYEVTEPLILYRGPTTRSSKLMTIEPGTKIKAINKLSFSWWNVELPDHYGWINPESLIPAGVPGVKPEVQPVKPQPNPEAREAPAEEVKEVVEDGPVYVLLGATSLRSRATHKSEVLLRFDEGDEVVLLEKTSQWWWKVSFQGNVGWVKAAKLEKQ